MHNASLVKVQHASCCLLGHLYQLSEQEHFHVRGCGCGVGLLQGSHTHTHAPRPMRTTGSDGLSCAVRSILDRSPRDMYSVTKQVHPANVLVPK